MADETGVATDEEEAEMVSALAEIETIPWYKQKTTWTGIAAIVGAAAGFATGGVTLMPAIQTALGGLAVIFLRQGVEKAK